MIKTRRWNDAAEADDGYRLLVCRYRPRGVSKQDETWDAWLPQLGPSPDLHAAYYGKSAAPIAWEEYAARYLAEVVSQAFWLRGFSEREARGEVLTLLCSSACVDVRLCHRSLLRELVLTKSAPAATAQSRVIRRR
ncbi:MAG: DUF488 family protein [Polyangiaceae bacterium]